MEALIGCYLISGGIESATILSKAFNALPKDVFSSSSLELNSESSPVVSSSSSKRSMYLNVVTESDIPDGFADELKRLALGLPDFVESYDIPDFDETAAEIKGYSI